jgi:hypothetical protein
MTNLVKTINVLLISALTILVGCLSAVFYIGNEHSYARLLQSLPSSFIRRFTGGVCVGLVGAMIIILINYLILKASSHKTAISLRNPFLLIVLFTSIASLIGTIVFFSHS